MLHLGTCKHVTQHIRAAHLCTSPPELRNGLLEFVHLFLTTRVDKPGDPASQVTFWSPGSGPSADFQLEIHQFQEHL